MYESTLRISSKIVRTSAILNMREMNCESSYHIVFYKLWCTYFFTKWTVILGDE